MDLSDIQAISVVDARKLPVEELVKAIYDGQTYIAWGAREQDKNGDWLKRVWNVHNSYDGNIVA